MKDNYKEEYALRKIVESFLFMKAVPEVDFINDENLSESEIAEAIKSDQIGRVRIRNKRDLYDYLIEDFSQVFFTPQKYA